MSKGYIIVYQQERRTGRRHVQSRLWQVLIAFMINSFQFDAF